MSPSLIQKILLSLLTIVIVIDMFGMPYGSALIGGMLVVLATIYLEKKITVIIGVIAICVFSYQFVVLGQIVMKS